MSDTQKMLDTFFHPDDQDAFARSQGWEDAAQMCYYEQLVIDAQAQESDELPPPPAVIHVHELDKVDSREVYGGIQIPLDEDGEPDWSRASFTSDMSGVY